MLRGSYALKPIRPALVAENGAPAFYKAVLDELPKGDNVVWSWPNWDRFFALAEEHGLTDVRESPNPQPGEIPVLAHPSIAMPILLLWRRAQVARRAGDTAAQFHRSEINKRRIDQEEIEKHARMQQQRKRDEREEAANEYKNKRFRGPAERDAEL